jgi:hypothetical protein
MQIPLLHQQIILQTEKLRDIHRQIMLHQSTAPAAEMNILLLEIRSLYSLAIQLNNENDIQLLNEIQLAFNNPPSPEVTPLTGIDARNDLAASRVEELKANAPIVKAIDLNQQTSSITETIQQEKKRHTTEIHEMFHETPKVGGKFTGQKTVGEKISFQSGTKSIAENLKSPVRDIKSAIGINEKFLFINQLFNGDTNKYNTVIAELNSCSTSEFALNTIKNLSLANDWESHPGAAKLFKEIVERRFV